MIPVLVDDRSPERRPRGAASAWWLDRSLDALAQSLHARGSRLILRSGDAAEVVLALVAETKAHAVYWNRLYAADQIARDSQLKSTLRAAGVEVKSFNSALLVEPFEIVNGSGQPFKVFTPFWRAARGQIRGQMQIPPAAPTPDTLIAPAHWPSSETKADWRPARRGPKPRCKSFSTGQLTNMARGATIWPTPQHPGFRPIWPLARLARARFGGR